MDGCFQNLQNRLWERVQSEPHSHNQGPPNRNYVHHCYYYFEVFYSYYDDYYYCCSYITVFAIAILTIFKTNMYYYYHNSDTSRALLCGIVWKKAMGGLGLSGLGLFQENLTISPLEFPRPQKHLHFLIDRITENPNLRSAPTQLGFGLVPKI